MKYDIMFLVVRLDGKVSSVTAIDECYTDCQVNLNSEYLIDEDIHKIYQGYDEPYIQKMIEIVRNDGYLYEEGEAKDLTNELSHYKIAIEHKEIDFE